MHSLKARGTRRLGRHDVISYGRHCRIRHYDSYNSYYGYDSYYSYNSYVMQCHQEMEAAIEQGRPAYGGRVCQGTLSGLRVLT